MGRTAAWVSARGTVRVVPYVEAGVVDMVWWIVCGMWAMTHGSRWALHGGPARRRSRVVPYVEAGMPSWAWAGSWRRFDLMP